MTTFQSSATFCIACGRDPDPGESCRPRDVLADLVGVQPEDVVSRPLIRSITYKGIDLTFVNWFDYEGFEVRLGPGGGDVPFRARGFWPYNQPEGALLGLVAASEDRDGAVTWSAERRKPHLDKRYALTGAQALDWLLGLDVK